MFTKNAYAASTSGGLDPAEILLSHHHHHQDDVDLLSAAAAHYHHPVPDPTVLYSSNNTNTNQSNAGVGEPPSSRSKKDRHSKINTAQGPRDRRVRLSIGVARKFFDLQEMLGFDKPSKTLDWLLTKSKSAIKHMVQTKASSTKTTFVECEDNNIAKPKEKSVVVPTSNKKKKRGKVDEKHQEAMSLAKESRAKARARARERTREKMCIKQQQQLRMNESNGYDLIPLDQYYHQQQDQEQLMIQESIVNKRRVLLKHTSTTNNNNPSIYGFQTTSYGMPDSWDISNYATQSSICAILDQHNKFNQ